MLRLTQRAGILSSQIVKINAVDRLKLVRMMHSLIKNQAYVNGKWINAGDNKSFNVTNPANQKVVGEVPDMNASDVQKAIDSAYDAFHSKAWQNTTAKDRSGLLKVSCHVLVSLKNQ
jgi:delta 1-pyrroline-5-carboxylate dehydrogenase